MSLPKHIKEHAMLGIESGGQGIDTSDANTVSVGVYGDYPTLDAALTYIQSQTCFNDITPAAADLPAVVQSFAQMESKVLIFDGSGGDFWSPATSPPLAPQNYWFQLAGDSFWYPLQGYQYVNSSTEQYLISKVRRSEATNSSGIADIAVSYKQAVLWTILLLDKVTDGGKTNISDFIALTKPVVIDIVGVVKSKIVYGNITFDQASAHYGRIHFKNCEDVRVRAANWSAGASEVSYFESVASDCHWTLVSGDFWGPPGMIYGSFEQYNCTFDHRQFVSGQQHITNVVCYGDFISDGSTLIDTPQLKSLGGDTTDLGFCDGVAARNVIYSNARVILNYNIDDFVDYFTIMDRVGGTNLTSASADYLQLIGAITNAICNNIAITVNGSAAAGPTVPRICIISNNTSSGGVVATPTCQVSNCSIAGNGCETYVFDNDADNSAIVSVSNSNGRINLGTNGVLVLEDRQTLTASGAIRNDAEYVELNHATQIAATIANAAQYRKPIKIKAILAPATTHTVVLTAGTWDGTNQTATFSAINEFLEVIFDSAGNGVVLNNVGVVLSA